MENGNKKIFPKRIGAKIIVPVLILAAIAGMWFLKNKKTQEPYIEDINPDFTLHVTKELNLEKLKSYGLPILIDFGADSCLPCREMAPVLVKLNRELQGKAIIKFVDVWKYQELAQGYPIRAIPTQIFFDKDGKPFKPSDPQGMRMIMYSSRDTGEHVFTVHEGGMTEEMIRAVFKEMGVE